MKIALPVFVFLSVLAPRGCHTVPLPPPANVPSAPALGEAEKTRLSQIGAHAEAAETANAKQPPGPVTNAVAGPLSVIRQLAGPATDKDRAAALALVNAALAGRVAEANAGWVQARADATALTEQLKMLEAQVAAERIEAAAELKRQLERARNEERARAEAREKLIVTCIFFGTGALCLLGAIAVVALKATVPIFGAEAALWLGIAGGVLIGTGILIRAINRLIEDHPVLFWGGLITAGLAVTGAVFLMRANHHHNTHPAEATP